MMKGGLTPNALTLLAVLALAIGGGAVYFQYNNMVEAEAKAKSLDSEVPEESELLADLEKAKGEITTLGAELTHLEAGVPQPAYIPTMLQELEQTSTNANLKVTGVRPIVPPPLPPGAERENKAYQEVEIDITGKGDYQSVINLVDMMRKFPKIVSVQTLNLTPKVEANQSTYSSLDTTMRLKAFVFPSNQPPQSTTKEVAGNPGGTS